MRKKYIHLQLKILTEFQSIRCAASTVNKPDAANSVHFHPVNDEYNTEVTNANCTKSNLKLPVRILRWMPSPIINTEGNQRWRQYKKLAKFRLTSLVVITTMSGYAMAPAPFNFTMFALCSLGTGLMSAAANAINQYHEVPFDSQMSRTKNRLLVTGQMSSLHAVGFAVASATTGFGMLYFGVNSLTALLGAGNFFLYTSIYTPMKRVSIMNTWIGSIVGALPPLMGWAGCTGTLDPGSLILAGLLYAWQFPHFNALSWNLRQDYSRAGYRMMAVTNPGLCRRTAFRYSIAIAVLSLLAPVFDVTNGWFVLESLPLNLYFVYLAHKFNESSDGGSSRKLFRYSLLHLPVLMLLLLANKKIWYLREPFGETTVIKNEICITHLPKMPSSPLLVKTAAGATNQSV
ncbi:protoheme IX farnesyltransferase, mitochondrial isoform X2 [Drosophila tropicalis]|uniref:protoheme IX farnesyltransferase, mitochondrial isoform X2 n=1 Tax=Drosophila tropicalis TaxID=46794 RepID=UPI0035AC1514